MGSSLRPPARKLLELSYHSSLSSAPSPLGCRPKLHGEEEREATSLPRGLHGSQSGPGGMTSAGQLMRRTGQTMPWKGLSPLGEGWKRQVLGNGAGPRMGSSSVGPFRAGSSSRVGGSKNESSWFPHPCRERETSWHRGTGGL